MPAYETEERDERGRWTSGGSAMPGAESKDVWDEHAHGLTADQEAAALTYTGEGSKAMNALLRDPGLHDMQYTVGAGVTLYSRSIPDLEDNIKMLDEAIASQPGTSQGTVLFRGVGPVHGGEYRALEPGATINDPAYMSATTSLDTAASFATTGFEGKGPTGAVLEIHAPAGTKGLDISAPGMDLHRGEEEVLLPHGTGMEVVEHIPPTEANEFMPRVVVNLVPQK